MAEGETMSTIPMNVDSVCGVCGSRNIKFRAMAWVDPAINQVAEFEITSFEDGWCETCNSEVDLVTEAIPCADCGEALYYDDDDEMYYHVKPGHECFLHGFKDESSKGAAGQLMALVGPF